MSVPEEATDNAHAISPPIAVVEDTIDRATRDPRGPGYLPAAKSHPLLLRRSRTLRRRRVVLRPAPTCFSVISFSLYMFARLSVNDRSTLRIAFVQMRNRFCDHSNRNVPPLQCPNANSSLRFCENSKAKELL